jgi:transposase-like protein
MYHCPDCTTELVAVEGAQRADVSRSGLFLDTLHYNCPGCGQQFLHWTKHYASHAPVDQWFHIGPSGQALLMHNPPTY